MVIISWNEFPFFEVNNKNIFPNAVKNFQWVSQITNSFEKFIDAFGRKTSNTLLKTIDIFQVDTDIIVCFKKLD